MRTLVQAVESLFGAVPLPLLEVWGRCAYLIGLVLAACAFGGFTFRLGGRIGFGRERQSWDARAILSIPLTFIAITAGGYLGSFIVLVPGAQTFESLKDLVVLLCIVYFGYPALLTVPFAYGLSDLIEGVPPSFLLDWLPGYFINPACFWIAYQLFGREPDFRRVNTWGRYAVFVGAFMALEPVLWGFICAGKFTPENSYRSITPALFFTTSITWILAPAAFVATLPLVRRTGLFWAEIDGHVKERAWGRREWAWISGRDSAGTASLPAATEGLPIRLFVLVPFVALVLLMVGTTAFVTMRSAATDANRLATRLHQEIADNLNLRLDEYLGGAPAGSVNETELARLLRSQPIATEGRAAIIDRAGTFLAGSTAEDDPIIRAVIAHLPAVAPAVEGRSSGTPFRFDHVTAKPLGRETWLGHATAYRDRQGGHTDWIVLTALPESFHLAGVQTGNSRSAILVAFALLLSLTVAAVLASAVATPLRRMVETTGALEQGDLGQRLPPSRLAELDTLAHAFNRMATRLQQSFDELRDEVMARKNREGELQASDNRMQLATKAGGLGVWDWDVARDQLLWDDAMYRLYGVRREEFGGAYEAWSTLLMPEDLARASADVQAALRGDREFSSEFRVRWRDGSVHTLRGAGRTIRDHEHRPVRMVGINWDVTEQLRVEQELREHRTRLEDLVAERTTALSVAVGQAETANRAKSSFLAHMSHEIRTPLNAILGFSQLLLRDPALSAAHREHLRVIDRNGAHLLELINDVLEMSKIEANRVTIHAAEFSPAQLVRDLESMFRARAEAKGLEFVVDFDATLPELARADDGKIRQILVNLLGNAVKFTTAGRVTFRVRRRAQNEAGWWLGCEIEDTGPGIAAEDQARLFRHFEQTDTGRTSGTGTGLGLAISREFARMMDGDITVRSEPGRGSMFGLDLPLARPAGRVAPTPAARAVRRLAAGEPACRVLVVDDQADNRNLARELLAGAGFTVTEAMDGRAAIEVFERENPQCILMDLRMPVMDGTESIRRIRALPTGAAVKILALSASVFVENRDETIAVGADDFLGKPFRESELFERLRRLTGVVYEYDDSSAGGPAEAAVTPTPQRLENVPPALVGALHAALEAADLDAFQSHTATLAAHAPQVSRELQVLAGRFDYAGLRRLLDASLPPTP